MRVGTAGALADHLPGSAARAAYACKSMLAAKLGDEALGGALGALEYLNAMRAPFHRHFLPSMAVK